VTWVGPQEFETGEPSVRAEPTTEAATAGTEPSADATGETPLGLVAVLAFVAVLGGGYVFYRRQRRNIDELPSSVGSDDSEEPPASHVDEAPSAATADTEFMTDAERVEQLLAAEGGTVKQAAIAEELDWSASKTSRVISGLADEGRVEKRRIGRENVVALPGEID